MTTQQLQEEEVVQRRRREGEEKEILLEYDGNLFAMEIIKDKLYTGGWDNKTKGKGGGIIKVMDLQSRSWSEIRTKSKGNIDALIGWKNGNIFASVYNSNTNSYTIEMINTHNFELCESYPTAEGSGVCLIEWRGYLVSAGGNDTINVWNTELKSIKYI